MLGSVPEIAAQLPPRVYVPHENGGDIAVIDPITPRNRRSLPGRHDATPRHAGV